MSKHTLPVVGLAAASALLVASFPSLAGTVWSEDFDTATPGQTLNSAPLNWQREYGTISVGPTSHSGWTGNSIIGSTFDVQPENFPGSSARVSIPSVPNTGVLYVSFRAWAPTSGSVGSYIDLTFDNGAVLFIQPWTNSWLDNAWVVSDNAIFTGSGSQFFWQSTSDFMRDRTVDITLMLDYRNNSFSTKFDDGTTNFLTPQFAFGGSPILSTIGVYVDARGGRNREDFDNLTVTAVPEPSTVAIMSLGLAGLFGIACRRALLNA